MKKAIIGRKLGMTQLFSENGDVIPVTVIEAGPCEIVQKKTEDNDGYDSIQLSFGEIKPKRVSKPREGHFKKYDTTPTRLIREFRIDDIDSLNSGDVIKVDVFEPGEKVDVSAKSKGKGFQGVIKRHGQARGPMSHGSKYHRRVGSMGASAYPARVPKGKKLPGQMGNKRVTVQGLEVVQVEPDENLILIKGSVPGPRGSFVDIKSSVKAPQA